MFECQDDVGNRGVRLSKQIVKVKQKPPHAAFRPTLARFAWWVLRFKRVRVFNGAQVAGRAMERNFTSLGPHVLPVSEMYKVARAMVLRDVFKRLRVSLEALQLASLARKVPVVS